MASPASLYASRSSLWRSGVAVGTSSSTSSSSRMAVAVASPAARGLRAANAHSAWTHRCMSSYRRTLPPSPTSCRLQAASSARSFTSSSILRGLGSASATQVVVAAQPVPQAHKPIKPKHLLTSREARQLGTPFRRERRVARKLAKQRAKKQKAANTLAAKLGLKTSALSPLVRKDHQFKTFKPITPSIRWVRFTVNDHLYKGRPERALTVAKRSTGGRNHHGHITVRGRGGGHRRRYRLVDFWRREWGAQTVENIQYDPNRSAHIALIKHQKTGARSYILAPDGLRSGDVVESFRDMKSISEYDPEGDGRKKAADSEGSNVSALDLGIFRTRAIRPGNALPLKLIPVGTTIHSIALNRWGPSKLVRSAGSSAKLVSFTNRSSRSPTAQALGGPANNAAEIESNSASAFPGGLPGSGRPNAPTPPPPGPGGAASSDEAAAMAAAGASAEGGASTATHAQVRLQSGEVRYLDVHCLAVIGRVSNVDHRLRMLGKAGRARWLGRRPKVRGVAMNAVDHPHGGGRGKSKSNKHPRSIWGHLEGMRTRKPGTKHGNKEVVRERPRWNGKRHNK